MKAAKLQGARQDLLWLLAEGTAAATGDEFFRSLARHAAEAMRAKYAFVAEFVSECESRTLVFWEGGDYGAGFSYRVAGTPCQRVLAGQYCAASSGLQQMYPKDPLLQSLGESLRRIMPFDLAALTVYEHDTDTLRRRAQHGQVKDPHLGVGQTADRTNSHFGLVFDHRQTLLRRNLGVERAFLTENSLFDEGIRSACTVPLLIADKCIGTVTVASRVAERYGQNDATFLESLGGQIALAVSNLLAFEEISSLKELAQPRQLTLEMSGVRYLDQRAKIFLWELIGKDVAIENCSPFVSEQLRA